MSVQGRARLCTIAPVFHLQDVGQNVGDSPVKLKRNLLIHLSGVVNRARQPRELDHFHLTFSKISPLKGIRRLFSSEHLAETGKMTVKSAVVLVMLWVSLRNNFAAFLGLQALPFKLAMNDGLSLYASVMRNFVILFIFFALLDVPLAKALFTKGLKMTKQELKEEYKNQEGKPEVKARVRRLQRQLAMGQIRKVVPKANVVITNPTHYAVALQYDQSRAAAPFVVAKTTRYG
jgi:flagellar biosynthesis protein FlhB